MENNNLIFFNTGNPKEDCLDFGKKMDIDSYRVGLLHVKIGQKEIYEKNIKPILGKSIYRENQYDFVSVVQLDIQDKISAAMVTAELSQSRIVKEIMAQLKKYIKMHYKMGLISTEEGFEVYNKSFSKYYWSKDILGKTNIYDWEGGLPKLKPIIFDPQKNI
jgi:hypothetical protein